MWLLAACASTAVGPSPASSTDEELVGKLAVLTRDFRGDVGIYVRHLPTGRTAALRADDLFPTASLVKVPILIGLFDRIEAGALEYRRSLVYREERLYPGEDLLGSFKEGERIALDKLAMLMVAMSDNTASLWCQELAGTGTAINRWLAGHGFEKTRVNSRTEGREADKGAWGWGQTTPREMAELLVWIREGRAVSPAASEEMVRLLSKSYWDGEALSQVPPTVHAASKQGAINASRSEVVLVDAPSGAYVFCVITKNQEDQSWKRDNEGLVLLREASRTLWEHFEPGSPWKPAPGADRY